MASFADHTRAHLTYQGSCYRHCAETTQFHLLQEEADRLIGFYACPSGYVSRVVYLAPVLDATWFRTWLASRVMGIGLQERDFRPASRYHWDNPGLAAGEGPVRQLYWTPPAQREGGQVVAGAFWCRGTTTQSGCGKLFRARVVEAPPLCPQCRR